MVRHGTPSSRANPLRFAPAAAASPRRPGDNPVAAPYAASSDAAQRIAFENRAAAALSAADVRVIFAARVSEQLELGAAAVLQPARRQGLLRLATTLGLRAFDANLIIAVEQDRARNGNPRARADANLALIPAPAERFELAAARRSRWIAFALAVLASAGVMFAALVAWIARG